MLPSNQNDLAKAKHPLVVSAEKFSFYYSIFALISLGSEIIYTMLIRPQRRETERAHVKNLRMSFDYQNATNGDWEGLMEATHRLEYYERFQQANNERFTYAIIALTLISLVFVNFVPRIMHHFQETLFTPVDDEAILENERLAFAAGPYGNILFCGAFRKDSIPSIPRSLSERNIVVFKDGTYSTLKKEECLKVHQQLFFNLFLSNNSLESYLLCSRYFPESFGDMSAFGFVTDKNYLRTFLGLTELTSQGKIEARMEMSDDLRKKDVFRALELKEFKKNVRALCELTVKLKNFPIEIIIEIAFMAGNWHCKPVALEARQKVMVGYSNFYKNPREKSEFDTIQLKKNMWNSKKIL